MKAQWSQKDVQGGTSWFLDAEWQLCSVRKCRSSARHPSGTKPLGFSQEHPLLCPRT